VVEHRGSAAPRPHEDRLVAEEPLEIRLAAPGAPARRAWVTMRTPGHDFELAAGFAVHEALATPASITRVAYCTDVDLSPEQAYNVVTLTVDRMPDLPERHGAHAGGSSACGVCGKDSVDEVLAVPRGPAWTGARPGADVVRSLPARLAEAQSVFARTGGVHAAGLFTAAGDLVVAREDVGRHNAVDKVTGARVLAGEPPAGACLVVSGRAGFELVQKAVSVGTGTLVAVGAPTHLAVDLAREAGLGLFGFARDDRCVEYA
jgi:FdhD protein